ncbi:MAG: hypothetical protein HRT47_11940 [Candidatus Caenarcaniphilales bacterium]|nr:hypothetical protein [Candidatus Caenarcaniphilales bacterium]
MYIVRSRKFVLLIALYFLTFAFSVQAAVPYRISNFSVDSSNFNNVGEGFELGIDFVMRSVSGFSSKRFDVRVAGQSVSAQLSGPGAFILTPEADNPKVADIEMTLDNVIIQAGANTRNVEVEVSFFLNASRSGEPLVTKRITIDLGSIANDDDGGGSNGGGQGGKDFRDKKSAREKKFENRIDRKVDDDTFITVIEVLDESFNMTFGPGGTIAPIPPETDLSQFTDEQRNATVNRISLLPKRFKIIIHHDKESVPETEAATFQVDNSPIINALKIGTNLRPDNYVLSEKEQAILDEDPDAELFYDITDRFNFQIFTDTTNSSRNSELNQTVFYADITDDLVRNIQTFKFNINARKLVNSLEAGIGLPLGTKPKDSYKLALDGLLLTNEESTLSSNEVLLIPQTTEKKSRLSLLSHNPLNLSISIAENSNLETVDSNKSRLSGFAYKSRFFNGDEEIRDNLFRSQIIVDDSSISSDSSSLSFDFDVNVSGRRNILLCKKEMFRDSIVKSLYTDLSFLGTNTSELAVNVDASIDEEIDIKVLDDPKFVRPNKARAKFNSKEKRGETRRTLRLGFSYSNILASREDPLVLDLKFLDDADSEISGFVYSIPNISKIKDAFTNTRDDIPLVYRRSLKLKKDTLDASGVTLGDLFLDEAANAAKVEISLRRDASYLESLDLPNDDEIESILENFTDRRIIIDVRK